MSAGAVRDADVVVVGGGFAGVEIAARAARAGVGSVLLVNPEPAFLFRPWLIYTATGGRSFEDTRFDLGRTAEHCGFELLDSLVAHVDLDGRVLETADGRRIRHRALGWATGAEADRSRIPGGHEHALWPCDVGDARALAERLASPDGGPEQIVVVLAGERPGPGLEYAAALAANAAGPDGADRVVRVLDSEGVMAAHLGRRATESIRRLFEQRGGRYESVSRIEHVDADHVRVDGGGWIRSDLTLVVGPLRGVSQGLPAATLDDRGFVLVDEHLRLRETRGAVAAGDVVAARGQKNWMVARRQAKIATSNLLAELAGAEAPPDRYDFDRAARLRLALPDLAGASVLVRNERMLASGRWLLLVRKAMDRSFLSKHALRG